MWRQLLFKLLYALLASFPTIYSEDKNLKRKKAVRKFLFDNTGLPSNSRARPKE